MALPSVTRSAISHQLHITVVGAGLGGLATAVALRSSQITPKPTVTVLESAPELGEFGAGIQVAPNVTRILHSFGLMQPLLQHGVRPIRGRQVRWQNGAELTRWAMNEDNRFWKAFGHEYYLVYRPDLHRMLLDRAQELGAEVLTGHEVVAYNHDDGKSRKARYGNSMSEGNIYGNGKGNGRSSSASSDDDDPHSEMREMVTCANGAVFRSHAVVAADGAKSKLNAVVMGKHIAATPTGDSAWRGMLRREQLMNDPVFADLELDQGPVVWLGPNRHVVGYFVHSGEYYNVVILVPDDEVDEETWKLKGDMRTLRAQFEGWDPRLRHMLDLIQDSWIWNLRDRPMLERWLHPQGDLVLLGDAAHPMLPYVGQGAAMAIEDAVVLTECLSHSVAHQWPIRRGMEVYQRLRMPRTLAMREAGRKNREYFHLPDGPEQVKRDAELAREVDGGAGSSKLNQLGDMAVLKEMYGNDVLLATKEALRRESLQLLKNSSSL